MGNGDFNFWLIVDSNFRFKFDPPDRDFSAWDYWLGKVQFSTIIATYSSISSLSY